MDNYAYNYGLIAIINISLEHVAVVQCIAVKLCTSSDCRSRSATL